MEIVSLILKIIIYRAIGSPRNVKYSVDGLYARYKRRLKGDMNMLLNNLTKTFEGLGMLHYASSKSTVSFSDQCKDVLTGVSCIGGKIVHSKIKIERIIKIIRNETILFINRSKYII